MGPRGLRPLSVTRRTTMNRHSVLRNVRVVDGTCPLPEDPALIEVAVAMRDTRQWGMVVDSRWRLVYVTDESSLTSGGGVELAPQPLGVHLFGPEAKAVNERWRFGFNTPEYLREAFAAVGGLVLADTPGGRDELRELVDPVLRDVVDELLPGDAAALSFVGTATASARDRVAVPTLLWRVREATGRLAGTAVLFKPAAGMATLGAMAMAGDVRHLERMLRVSKA